MEEEVRFDLSCWLLPRLRFLLALLGLAEEAGSTASTAE